MEAAASASFSYYASAEEAAGFFARLKALPENQVCVDCSSANPQWASVNNGVFICLECSVEHRTLGVQISLVRSLTMDKWTPHQMRFMELGGNKEFLDYLKKQDLSPDSKSVDKYKSNLSALYRDALKAKANKDPEETNEGTAHGQHEKHAISFDTSHLTGMMANVFGSEKGSHQANTTPPDQQTTQPTYRHVHEDDDVLRFNVDLSVESMQKGIHLLTTSSKKVASTAATKLQESQIIERLRVSSGKGWSSLHSGWSSAVSTIKKEIIPPPSQSSSTNDSNSDPEAEVQNTESVPQTVNSSTLTSEESHGVMDNEQSSKQENQSPAEPHDTTTESKASITKKAVEVSSQLLTASGKGWSAMKGYLGQTQAKIKSRSYSDFLGTSPTTKQAPEAISLDSGSSSPASIGRAEYGNSGPDFGLDGGRQERYESSSPKFGTPHSQGSPGSFLPISSTKRKNTRKESASILKVADVQDFLSQLEQPPATGEGNSSPGITTRILEKSQSADVLLSPHEDANAHAHAYADVVPLSSAIEERSMGKCSSVDDLDEWHIVVPPIAGQTENS